MKITKVAGARKPLEVEEVEIRESLVEDLVTAERIVGKTEGFEFILAVLSQVALFDGQPQPVEELRRLSSKDFLAISKELELADVESLQNELSTSSGKEGSVKNA
ncbi:hypothetical protein [Geobacter sp.]|uniref:hypothetical protein n=1 Tax=Geobacter sp. TaxID=46610 RepID=UPI002602F3D5|nr:hypothetical protein [Geobacter sp.]